MEIKKYKRKSKIPWQVLDDVTLILATDNSMAHELNETGGWVWQQLEKEKSFDDLLMALLKEFDIDDAVARNDLTVYLDELATKGLVEYV